MKWTLLLSLSLSLSLSLHPLLSLTTVFQVRVTGKQTKSTKGMQTFEQTNKYLSRLLLQVMRMDKGWDVCKRGGERDLYALAHGRRLTVRQVGQLLNYLCYNASTTVGSRHYFNHRDREILIACVIPLHPLEWTSALSEHKLHPGCWANVSNDSHSGRKNFLFLLKCQLWGWKSSFFILQSMNAIF